MNPFIRKLRQGARLTEQDKAILAKVSEPGGAVERGDIVPEGTEPRFIALILDGWACRYKQLENGKRQIIALYVPGDLCEPFGAMPPARNLTLSALTPAIVTRVAPAALSAAAATSAPISEALWWDLLLGDGISQEHMVSLGRRSATERLGHFFCEMHVRLQMIGLVDQSSFPLPLTQPDLADLFGLSAVHVNRSLQELRGSGLVSLRNRRMTIHHLDPLRELSMFDPSYLEPNGPARA